MNVETGTEAAQFLSGEYLNVIFNAVYPSTHMKIIVNFFDVQYIQYYLLIEGKI